MYTFFARDMAAFIIDITVYVAAETLKMKYPSLGN
jgi:hypothetical protein